MKDKEQIMIDGVDVSKCRYFLKDTEGQDYNTDEFVKGCCEAKGSCIGYEFAGYGLCRGDKDCYFKQLARKTQECEELKDKINIYKKMFDNSEFRVALTDIRTGERDIREQRDRRLTKENEDLKESLNSFEKGEETERFVDRIKNAIKDIKSLKDLDEGGNKNDR